MENEPPPSPLSDFRRARPIELDVKPGANLPSIALDDVKQRTLRAAIDCIIPPDEFPGGWEAGAGDYILRQLNGDLRHLAGEFVAGLDALDREAIARLGHPFAEIPFADQTALLNRLGSGDVSFEWRVAPQQFLAMLAHLSQEGFYADPGNGGNRNEISWKMIGYEHRPLGKQQGGPLHLTTSVQTQTPTPAISEEYDAIVIGAGAAGGVVAMVLAEAGRRVLLLERGGNFSRYDDVSRDHLRNHRLAVYGHNLGPDLAGNPRVFVDPQGVAQTVRPNEWAWHNNAMAVGGGTRIFGAQAWRFVPQDFRMASLYGTPDDSSLADWPISFDDLEPFYTRAEWEVGVSGDNYARPFTAPRSRPYPMPPVPDNPQRFTLERGAASIGWRTQPLPLFINTAIYNNRPACVQCGSCVGFACPSDSKNGSHNTAIPRALATGNCRLVTGAVVERIETDSHGKAIGVSWFTLDDPTAQRHTTRAKTIISSAGAIESARLLLNSRSAREPQGLGNNYDQVGRHLQGHYYPSAFGLFPDDQYDGNGPGVSVACCQFNHHNEDVIGGGMLSNAFITMPLMFWRQFLPPDLQKWGLSCKRFMRENYRRVVQIHGPVQEIPSPLSRVTIDPSVRDRWGIPVARLSGTTHPQTVRTAQFMTDKAEKWLHASGATKVWSNPVDLHLSADQHQAGTCRMGLDPTTSVTNSFGCVHGHDNLYVIDGSLHVTNGGFNPALTIFALAYRCAEELLRG